jgi:hypothetical protein
MADWSIQNIKKNQKPLEKQKSKEASMSWQDKGSTHTERRA